MKYSNRIPFKKPKIEGEPWLVGRDVVKILGYSNPSKAVIMYVDEDDRTKEKGDMRYE